MRQLIKQAFLFTCFLAYLFAFCFLSFLVCLAEDSYMITLAVTNSKGGVGKSATAHALAACFARTMPTLLVDADAQHSVSDHCGFNNPESQSLLLDALLGNIAAEDAIVETTVDNLDLMPSCWNMYSADKSLANEPGADGLLSSLLSQDSLLRRYSAVVIDSPPSIGIMNYNAIIASSGIVIPTETSHTALSATKSILRVISLLKERRAPSISVLGIVPTRTTRTNSSAEAIRLLREYFGELVTQTTISNSIAVADAPSFRKSIIEYKPRSKPAIEYVALADELLSRINNQEGQRNAA